MGARSAMEDEFREFVAARSAALLRTAFLLAGDWATAEDLLQIALTKTYLAWRRLGEIEAVEPYARRVLINTATSWWRRRWHGERPTEIMPERAGPDRIEEQLDRDALWRHVKALPARQRAVLVLRFYEDLSEAQTAALLNISVGTVKSQTSRALNALRRRLSAEDDLLARRWAEAGPEPAQRAGQPPRGVEVPVEGVPQGAPAEEAPEEAPAEDLPAVATLAEPAPSAYAGAPAGDRVKVPVPRGGSRTGMSRQPLTMPIAPGRGLPAARVDRRRT